MPGFSAPGSVSQPRDLPKKRRRKHPLQRCLILLMSPARRNHVVGYPAGQAQPGLLNGLGSQHRMVDTAEFDPYHQNYRQLLGLPPVSKGLVRRKWRKPTTGALHQYLVSLAFKGA